MLWTIIGRMMLLIRLRNDTYDVYNYRDDLTDVFKSHVTAQLPQDNDIRIRNAGRSVVVAQINLLWQSKTACCMLVLLITPLL